MFTVFDPRLMALIAAIVTGSAALPATAGGFVTRPCPGTVSSACDGQIQLAQFGDDDDKAPIPAPAPVQVDELQVCTDAGCRKAAASHTPADIMRGIYALLKANENDPAEPCESDPASRKCKESGFSLFVMAGPLPAFASLKTMTFKNVRLASDNSEITMRIGITGTFLGAPANCGEFDAALTLNERNNPVLKGKESVYCNWLVIGNIFWDYTHTFDYIDFVKGVMGGQFEFSAIGLLTVGGASGYGQINLEPAAPVGEPTAAAPDAGAVAAKPPAIPAPAPVQGDDQQLAALRDLHDKGLIDDDMFRRRQQAILQRMFGAMPPAAVETAARPASRARPVAIGDIAFGNYFALVIGNNDYKFLPKLKTARADAIAVAQVLGEKYDFNVALLLNATRYDILKEMARLRGVLTENDSLLIYYAGHGILDEAAEQGYWLPVDAEENIKSYWISNADITDSLKATNAWHVMVVADSCYSGALVRGAIPAMKAVGGDRGALLERLALKKSRTVLTSGGLEPVVDSGGGRHSVFAKAFLDVLTENDQALEGQQVFTALRARVVLNADQTPEYADVRKAGHDGGDFVFVPKL